LKRIKREDVGSEATYGGGDVVKLLTNSRGVQVLFFAYPIKAAKGHAEGVEFNQNRCQVSTFDIRPS